jgi:citrate lyase beta subunit
MNATNTAFPRRSLLFMPGDSLRKMQKAATWEVDTVILDLEDAVAQSQKEAARAITAEALATLDFGGRERLVRVNHVSSGLPEVEVAATSGGRPDGYILPKVEDPADLHALDHFVAQAERAHGLPERSIRLFAMIETALGVMNLREIAAATPRLEGLIFGAEDLAGDIGSIRTPAGLGGLLCAQRRGDRSRGLSSASLRHDFRRFQRRCRAGSRGARGAAAWLHRQDLHPSEPDAHREPRLLAESG